MSDEDKVIPIIFYVSSKSKKQLSHLAMLEEIAAELDKAEKNLEDEASRTYVRHINYLLNRLGQSENALEFYAEPENWEPVGKGVNMTPEQTYYDRGEKARALLADLRK